MRTVLATLIVATCMLHAPRDASADDARKPAVATKPWCAPEVSELSDHVCYFEGGTPAQSSRRTLVIYLHGALYDAPGFQWLQQRAMAIHAKRLGFTVLIPTSPKEDLSYVWPTSQSAMKDEEPAIVANIARARAELEERVGHGFDETFIVGFSSGAYYGSSLAVRGGLHVDGTIVLAGGSAYIPPKEVAPRGSRPPIFVGVSAADSQTAGHSRAFGATLAQLGWPHRVEERNAGHMVDWALITHGIAWLRAEHDRLSAEH